jgi:hypothetical protein
MSDKMIALMTYGDEIFSESRDWLAASARKFGVPVSFVYSRRELIETDFYKANRDVLDQPKGGGYWLWKPYFILKTLKMLSNGDILIYCDSGSEIVSAPHEFAEICTKNTDVAVFSTKGIPNKRWTKRDVFVYLGVDTEKYWDMEQAWAMYAVFRKSDFSMEFVEEWLRIATSANLITDAPNSLGKSDLPEFIMHKHDQSILSVLCAKWGISPHRLPSQYGNDFRKDYPDDAYPQIFKDNHLRNLSQNSGIGMVWLHSKRDFCAILTSIKSIFKRIKFIPRGIWNSIYRRIPRPKQCDE